MESINVFHQNKDGEKYLTFKPLDELGVINAFSTREFGNMGLHTGDDPQKVVLNRKNYLDSQKLDIKNVVTAKQMHTTNVKIVDKAFKGKGALDYTSAVDNTDGLITKESDLILLTCYADCVPIYVYDPVKEVVASLHAGWKGTVGMIGKNAIKKMKNTFKTNPLDCIIVIGPSIGSCCYEVDEKVLLLFKEAGFNIDNLFKKTIPGHYKLDLVKANKEVFLKSGVPKENIYVSGLCTACNNDLFYSYRKSGGRAGRMAAIIGLKSG